MHNAETQTITEKYIIKLQAMNTKI